MSVWLDGVTFLIGFLALAYALKRLLPASVWRRGDDRTAPAAAGGCAGACSGCVASTAHTAKSE